MLSGIGGMFSQRGAEERLCVRILSSAGEETAMYVDRNFTVTELKRELAKVWHVPADFVKFVRETTVLKDCAALGEYLEHCDEGMELCVTGLVSDNGILTHESTAVRRAAIESLSRYADKGNPKVVRVLANFCSDENDIARQFALDALSKAADSFDEFVIEVLSECLTDENELVRCKALHALGAASETKNSEAASLLLDCLECLEGEPDLVKIAVISAVSKVPSTFRSRAMKGLMPRVSDRQVVSAAAHSAISMLTGRPS
eukprot:TRINITY_DN65195_c0_g1_i1.p2 TRINITY_DN65195_c0_g1~~TRINITY_DN65195_c0_g1_i1.p2  ORF type:complete len:260 (-),score=48.55 TRINITY_DN65195_c0_g1_i1:24-803(-)